jgi:hypothetical protein
MRLSSLSRFTDFSRFKRAKISFRPVRAGGWLSQNLGDDLDPPVLPIHATIESRARLTNRSGERPLWEGYKAATDYPFATSGSRAPDQVRTAAAMGRFFSWLAASRGGGNVVEFGTAFGVSGMYWLAGLARGHLYTFEPNADWAGLARENLQAISPNFTLTNGTFEDEGPKVLPPGSADIAFVDAIHTAAFVDRQYETLKPLMKPGGLVLFDDINFSDDMARCWVRIAAGAGLAASGTLDSRVGIVELPA